MIFLVLVFLLCVPAFAAEPTIVAGGECGKNGDNLMWILDSEGELTISGTGEMKYYSSVYSNIAPWYDLRESILSVVVEDGVTSIGGYAFYYCMNMVEISLPDSVKNIGDGAFYYCINLTDLTIPGAVDGIGAYAFCCCSNLGDIAVPGGVYLLGEGAFGGCSSATNITIGEGVAEIGNNAFVGCSSVTEVIIPDSVIQIWDYAFAECKSLANIEFGNNLEIIGAGAFCDCESLINVVLPDSVRVIEESSFAGCTNLTSIFIPDGTISIGDYVFENCVNLTDIDMPDSGTYVGKGVFIGCEKIVDKDGFVIIDSTVYGYYGGENVVFVPEGVREIGDNAFSGNREIKKVVIPEGVTGIGFGAFSYCNYLSSVTIPDSLTSIGSYAFYDCFDLPYIYIPAGVTHIANKTFDGCRKLKDVYYDGTEEMWEKIEIDSGNNTLLNADIHFAESAHSFPEITRIYGLNRYETAFETANAIKELRGIDKFDCIVVASGEDFADALSGSYLANRKGAPIILVNPKNTTNMTNAKTYIRENLVKGGTVYLLGGENAIPEFMDSALGVCEVKRLSGATRYETNLAILREAGIGNEGILVCTGMDFADGLSASAVNKPIMLVKGKLTDSQKKFLSDNRGNKIYIIGGTNAINADVEAELESYGSVLRLSGDNRYQTSVEIAKTFFPNAESAVLAYGMNFPDGLSGGSLAYTLDAPLILTTNPKQSVAAEHAKLYGITSGAILGGPTLISDNAVRNIFSMSSGAQIMVK